MVPNMVPIEYAVCVQQLHCPYVSHVHMCGTVYNFDSVVSKICMCLENGPRTGDSEYEPYWIDVSALAFRIYIENNNKNCVTRNQKEELTTFYSCYENTDNK